MIRKSLNSKVFCLAAEAPRLCLAASRAKRIFLLSHCQVGQKGFLRLQAPRRALELVPFHALLLAAPIERLFPAPMRAVVCTGTFSTAK